jgi:serine/threonine-protein kinase
MARMPPSAPDFEGTLVSEQRAEPARSDFSVTIPEHSVGATTVAPTAVGEELPPDLLNDPTFLQRYGVGEALGEGGMGIVRTCTDRRIGREIAMKSVKPGKGSRGDLAARFLREACVQGQLEHPAIVPVYDLGRDPDGTLYFTMKRVRGLTFERIIDGLRMGEVPSSASPDSVRHYSRRKLLTAFASVCHAVDFAHARGVVHRDLKPGNVMLGDFGEVYVLDWGLAKILGGLDPRPPSGAPPIASGSDPGAKTVHGATMGTPGYMAPEQVRGESVDVRADVYALGAILFELLALEPLHKHSTPQIALDSTLAGIDARPSVRAPRSDVPPELDEACVRATALDPELRTGSVRELVDAVESYLDGDRDLARRRELAREHARRAEGLAARALGDEPEGTPQRAPEHGAADATTARSRALHEVGRAIALDPTNEDAVRTLMRLMTVPPRVPPPEAHAAIVAERRSSMRMAARVAMIAYLMWFAYLPLMLWMGIRSWTAWSVASAAWLVAAAFAFRAWRNPSREGKPDMAMTVAGVTAVATTSTMFGPYVLVPTLAAMGAMLLHMAPNRGHRVPVVVMNCLAIAVPAALQLSGVVPASFAVSNDAITVAPVMLSFPPVPTHVFLVVACVTLVIIASAMIARFRNVVTRVEEHLHVQAWQLRQLVPEQVRPASAPPPAESSVQLPTGE